MIFAALICCGIAYNMLAIAGGLRFRRQRRRHVHSSGEPVSILKAVRGRDPHFYEALESHARQQYPAFEILFGISDPSDPAVHDIERLRANFPDLPVRVFDTRNDAPNGKVGSLQILAEHARHDILLVNDSDIAVEADYLARVAGLLTDDVGVVTCLYRGRGASAATKAEALGIATEFAPSVLVARLVTSGGFALGSTMAFRKRELEAIGGFAALRDYLADDYQLGARISALGKPVVLADSVVETSVGDGPFSEVWKHQVRWSRTIRASRRLGYLGYAVTHLTFWCLAAAVAGYWRLALAGIAIRMVAAVNTLLVLDDVRSLRIVAAVPLRDLLGFAVWCAGLAGNVVEWRGLRFRLFTDGRIAPL